MRRSIIVIAITTGAALASAALDCLAAGPGVFRSRSAPRGQTSTRVYRSYSVTPSAETTEGSSVTEAMPQSAPGASRPRKSSSSKPSYMRADSKASGRFGQ